MSLHVVEPGWSTRVVDLGRPRTRSLGVPVGGAADRASFLLGSALVGNPADAAALEITGKGPTLRAACDLACVLFGAPFDIVSTHQQLTARKTFTLHEGEEIRIGGTPLGMRAYFCVQGGLAVPEILGSRSSLEALAGPTTFACQRGNIGQRFLPPHLFTLDTEQGPLRVLCGLQASWFNVEEFRQEYTVTSASNRMGLRLLGKPLTFPEREMVSEPVCPGAVQVTRDGQCIILGVDGQTIGGYPKIAQVIAADLDRLGQVRPGQRLMFRSITLAEAVELYRRQQEELAEWVLRARVSVQETKPNRE